MKSSEALIQIERAIKEVEDYVNQRIKEFEDLGKNGRTKYNFKPFLDIEFEAGIFSELCFCILTANFSASRGIKIQAELKDEGFMTKSFEELTDVFKKYGHRFPEQRAERIVELRKRWKTLEEVLKKEKNAKILRERLANSSSPYKIKGFGYKEASHFLRNIGFKDVAIIDRHIFRFLTETGLFPQVKTLTPKRYIEAEKALEKLCKELGITQAELDLYIFYIKTKKVLK